MFIPRAILAFLWNLLSGAPPFRKKAMAPTGAGGGAWRPKGVVGLKGGKGHDDPRGGRPGPYSRS